MLADRLKSALSAKKVWDLSGASYEKVTGTFMGSANFGGLCVSYDGSNMYVVTTTGYIQQFSMTAGDLDTISYVRQTLLLNSPNCRGVHWKADGTKFWVIADAGATSELVGFSVATAWNITGATSIGTDYIDTTSREVDPLDLCVSSTGNRLFIIGGSSDDIIEYNLSTAWQFNTGTYKDVKVLSGNPPGVAISEDGTKLFYIQSGVVYCVTLNTPHTLWDGNAALNSFTLGTPGAGAKCLTFLGDGSKFYTYSATDDKLVQYAIN